MKKTSFILGLALFCTPLSLSAQNEATFPTGIYAGVGGGYNSTKSTVGESTITETDSPQPNSIFFIPGTRNGVSSLLVNALLGYLHRFNDSNITTGLELFFSYHMGSNIYRNDRRNAALNNLHAEIETKIHDKYEYGLKGLLGYIFYECYHLYGLVGVSNHSFATDTSFAVLNAGSRSTKFSRNKINKVSFLLGLGVEKAFQNFKFGMEWFYRFGTKKRSSDIETLFAGEPAFSSTPRKIDSSYCILFKAIYNFNFFGQ